MVVTKEDWDSLLKRVFELEAKQMEQVIELHVLKDSVNENTKALQEWIDLGKEFKIGLKFLGYIEKAAVWLTKVAAAIALMWAVWRFGVSQALSAISGK